MNKCLAFVLYKYFPYGGLARDFKRIADQCIKKGYEVDVFVMEWHGDFIKNYGVHVLKSSGWTNHAKVRNFHQQVKKELDKGVYAAVIGFNRMPGLDVYYAADPCYVDRFYQAGWLKKLNPRYQFYAAMEASVFSQDSHTLCLMISDVQRSLFKQHYQTPDERLVMLPPGIDLDRRRPKETVHLREEFRKKLGFKESELIILMVGTGFKTKGVDRAIEALSSLQKNKSAQVHLVVVGEDDLARYKRIAIDHKVANKTHFMGGRSDVPKFLLSADILLHSARKDNTGTVILEAIVAGLPVIATKVCGYAKHVLAAGAGRVIGEPFQQKELNAQLAKMIFSDDRAALSKQALKYADKEDLYSMPIKAAEWIDRVVSEKKNAV